MEMEQIIGIVASICTGVSLLPQLIKIIKEKKADHLSLGMMMVLLGGYILWITYGFFKSDLIIIISNIVSLLLNIATIVMSLKYKGSKNS
ncbi:MAG: SemiSWEET family sugar transporter [Pseudobacter sp.]|uniref:SemiSWEET family sugar transporter n=1 Tax=Pseudobacter sp. TaxID=2045420 RepID=UPI003F7E2B3F